MLYHLHDLKHALTTPLRLQAEAIKMAIDNPFNPLHYTSLGRSIAANAEMIERMTRRFGKPAFGLDTTTINGKTVKITEKSSRQSLLARSSILNGIAIAMTRNCY